MTIFSNVLVCFNSSINFVIYCIFGRKFRLKFLRLLRLNRWKFCNRRQYRSSSTSAAAASSCSARTVTIPFNRHHGGAMMMMMNRGDSTILNGPNNEKINNNNQHNHQKSNWSSMVEGQLKIELQQQQQTKLQPQQQPTPPPMTMENVRFLPSIIRSNTFGSYSNQTIHTMNNQHHNDDDVDSYYCLIHTDTICIYSFRQLLASSVCLSFSVLIVTDNNNNNNIIFFLGPLSFIIDTNTHTHTKHS